MTDPLSSATPTLLNSLLNLNLNINFNPETMMHDIYNLKYRQMDTLYEPVLFESLIRSFVCNTKRPSVKRSMKWQVSSNLADEPTLADVLPPPPI